MNTRSPGLSAQTQIWRKAGGEVASTIAVMNNPLVCPECRATLQPGRACADSFHMLAFWELDHGLYDVHHLMVPSYHIQHPSLYSPEGLLQAQQILIEFVEQGTTPQAMRRKLAAQVASNVRTAKITGTPESHGSYARPMDWTWRVTDVEAAGLASYYNSVRTWAASIVAALRQLDGPD